MSDSNLDSERDRKSRSKREDRVDFNTGKTRDVFDVAFFQDIERDETESRQFLGRSKKSILARPQDLKVQVLPKKSENDSREYLVI
jgi:hypothetical protein